MICNTLSTETNIYTHTNTYTDIILVALPDKPIKGNFKYHCQPHQQVWIWMFHASFCTAVYNWIVVLAVSGIATVKLLVDWFLIDLLIDWIDRACYIVAKPISAHRHLTKLQWTIFRFSLSCLRPKRSCCFNMSLRFFANRQQDQWTVTSDWHPVKLIFGHIADAHTSTSRKCEQITCQQHERQLVGAFFVGLFRSRTVNAPVNKSALVFEPHAFESP